jgi:hypothetical protein
MITTPASIGNKTTKVQRLKEDGFCIFCIFFYLGFCFVVGPFYDNIFVKLKKYISPKI